MAEVRLLHRGVGPSIRTWTLRVCPECGAAKVDDRYTACEQSHRWTATESVEVVEAEPVLWARDSAMASAEKWRREADRLSAACEAPDA